MPRVRLPVSLVVVAYLVAPLPRLVGVLGHDVVHRSRGEDPMHVHGHDHHAHPHGSDHHHDVVLDLLVRLQEAHPDGGPDQPGPPPAPERSAPRFDHLVPAVPALAATPATALHAAGREASSPRSLVTAPPSPPPRLAA